MEEEKTLVKIVSLLPQYLNKKMINTIVYILKNKYEKSCSEEDGLILTINKIHHITNVISKDSKEIYFQVSFSANTVKPEKGMKISFIPTLIINKGIFGKVYDMFSIFIPETNLKSYTFNNEKGNESFSHKIKTHVLSRDTHVKAVISDIKFSGTKYNCLCVLEDIMDNYG